MCVRVCVCVSVSYVRFFHEQRCARGEFEFSRDGIVEAYQGGGEFLLYSGLGFLGFVVLCALQALRLWCHERHRPKPAQVQAEESKSSEGVEDRQQQQQQQQQQQHQTDEPLPVAAALPGQPEEVDAPLLVAAALREQQQQQQQQQEQQQHIRLLAPEVGAPLLVAAALRQQPAAASRRVDIVTGLQRLACMGGATSFGGYDLRSGNPGQVNRVSISHPPLPGGHITGICFFYRFVVGYSGNPESNSPGPSFSLVARDGERLHVLFRSPTFYPRPYCWDDPGHPKNYSPVNPVHVTNLAVLSHNDVKLELVFDNQSRNMHLQGGEGEGCHLNLALFIAPFANDSRPLGRGRRQRGVNEWEKRSRSTRANTRRLLV